MRGDDADDNRGVVSNGATVRKSVGDDGTDGTCRTARPPNAAWIDWNLLSARSLVGEQPQQEMIMSGTPGHRTGGPAPSSIGNSDSTEQPDSQKGSAANAVGAKGADGDSGAPDVNQDGGKQPTDPVQNDG